MNDPPTNATFDRYRYAWIQTKGLDVSTTELTLKSLNLLSPGLANDFDEQLQAAVLDCKQRPSLAKKREITIKLTITPHPEDPDDVSIQPVTTRKTPARTIEVVRARRSKRNQLQFDFSEGDL